MRPSIDPFERSVPTVVSRAGRPSRVEVRIRPARSGDVPVLTRMRLALEAHVKSENPRVWDLSRSRAAGLPEFYRRLLRSRDAVVVVAETPPGNEVVGMAIGRVQRHPQFEPSRSGRIDDVWVDPGYRRRSVARRMMVQMARHFRERGIRTLLLEYAIGNRGAEKTWPRIGFSPVFVGATADVAAVLRRK